MKTLRKTLLLLTITFSLIISCSEKEAQAASYSGTALSNGYNFYTNITANTGETLVYNETDECFYFGYRAGTALGSIGYDELGHIFTVRISGIGDYPVAAVIGQSEVEVGSQQDKSDGYSYRLFKIPYKTIQQKLEQRYPSINFAGVYDIKTVRVKVDTIMTPWNKVNGIKVRKGSVSETSAGWISGNNIYYTADTWHTAYPYSTPGEWVAEGFFEHWVTIYTKTPLVTNTPKFSGLKTYYYCNNPSTFAPTNTTNFIKAGSEFQVKITGKTDFATTNFQPDSSYLGVTNSDGTIIQLAQVGVANGANRNQAYQRWLVGNNLTNYAVLNSFSASREADMKTFTGIFNVSMSTHKQKLTFYTASAVHKGGILLDGVGWANEKNTLISISTGDATQWSGYFSKNGTTVVADGLAPTLSMGNCYKAHDIRTGKNCILGFFETRLDALSEAKRKGIVATIKEINAMSDSELNKIFEEKKIIYQASGISNETYKCI